MFDFFVGEGDELTPGKVQKEEPHQDKRGNLRQVEFSPLKNIVPSNFFQIFRKRQIKIYLYVSF